MGAALMSDFRLPRWILLGPEIERRKSQFACRAIIQLLYDSEVAILNPYRYKDTHIYREVNCGIYT